MSSTWRRPRMGVRGFVLALLIIGGAMDIGLTAGQASPPPNGPEQGAAEPTGFRQFPGGKVVPNLRAGLPPRWPRLPCGPTRTASCPRAFGSATMASPSSPRWAATASSGSASNTGASRLAAGSTYVAIVGRNGKLLSSRFQNIPHAVDATAPTVGASAAAGGRDRPRPEHAGPVGHVVGDDARARSLGRRAAAGPALLVDDGARNAGRARYARPRSIRSPRSRRRWSCRGRTSSATTRSTRGLTSGTSPRTSRR